MFLFVPQKKEIKEFQHRLTWPFVVFSHPSAVYSSVVSICSCHDSLEKVTHLMTSVWYLLNINQFLSIQGDEFIFSFRRSFMFSPTPLCYGIWDQPLHCTEPPVARCSISLYFCSELWCSPRCSPASALCSQISLRLISPPAVKTTHNLAPHTSPLFMLACLYTYVLERKVARQMTNMEKWVLGSHSLCFPLLVRLSCIVCPRPGYRWSRKEINN